MQAAKPERHFHMAINVELAVNTKQRLWLRLLIINVRLFEQLNNFQVDK